MIRIIIVHGLFNQLDTCEKFPQLIILYNQQTPNIACVYYIEILHLIASQ